MFARCEATPLQDITDSGAPAAKSMRPCPPTPHHGDCPPVPTATTSSSAHFVSPAHTCISASRAASSRFCSLSSSLDASASSTVVRRCSSVASK
eukprot:5257-Chlamydomonas_euryale.AAC.1